MVEAVLQKLAKVEEKFPEEVKEVKGYLEAVRDKNVAVLGQDECFKLTDQAGGQILAFKGVVRLAASDGTLTQPVPGGPFVISAQGYERLNEGTGTIVMNAPTVMVDGQARENPYVKRDPQNNKITAIYCRAIAFRYTSKGIPAVSDRTTIFDVVSYRLIDLLAKAKKFPQAFRLLPTGMIAEANENQTWAAYPFDENTTLWVNTSHDEALQFYSQIINREKKAIDIAQTFAQRNAAKHIHNLAQAPGPKWDVPVICWRPVNGSVIKWDQTRYLQAQSTIAALAEGKRQGDINVLELQRGTDYVDEAPEAIREMLDPEDLEHEETTGTVQEPLTDEPEKDGGHQVEDPNNPVWAQLRATIEQVQDIFEEAVEELGLKMEGITTVAQAQKVMDKCNEIAGRV